MSDTDSDWDDSPPRQQPSWAVRVRKLREGLRAGINEVDYAGGEVVKFGRQVQKAASAARQMEHEIEDKYFSDDDDGDLAKPATQPRRPPTVISQPVAGTVKHLKVKAAPAIDKNTLLDVVNRYLDGEDFHTALAVTSELINTVMHDIDELGEHRRQLIGSSKDPVEVRDASLRDRRVTSVSGRSELDAISKQDAELLTYWASTCGRDLKLAYEALRGIKRVVDNKVSGAPNSTSKAVTNLQDDFDEAMETVRTLAGEEAEERRAKVFATRLHAWIDMRWPGVKPASLDEELEEAKHKQLVCEDLRNLSSNTVLGQVALYNLFTIIDRTVEQFAKYAHSFGSSDEWPASSFSPPQSSSIRPKQHVLVHTGVLTDED